ncbi:MAG TPA: glycosyltransferase [Cyclobacteriaceae bacterium]|nr:glycosyltransferase [Cyclobacteriaceae bacterium]HMV08560.1 glycosyltransferase [Cyclobacteriaceae bacterium]HMV90105.1 glycosyltransferase [Cyclobacteriaceae bacterium]HMX00231.1 glycosyltransferase [Cyclobacteriaceae bacterium]HMX49770.1 glycosyltransferase [Cyclobacteriaceae bacterium]
MVRILEIAAMTFVFIIIFLSYVVVMFGLITGWIKAMGINVPGVVKEKFISVIVAFRNEEATIGRLIDDLQEQEYPRDKFEVVLINDHSEDNSVSVINESLRGPISSKLMNNATPGKKSALTKGIRHSVGTIMVTTDADCRMGKDWLRSINNSFYDESVKMTFGPVKFQTDDTLFSTMQAIEFSSLIGSGAATAAFGFPTLCNGANLAFTKDVFTETGGYDGNEHIASGDDEFLMRKIEAKYPGGIRFNNSPDSLVTTTPQQTLNEFLNQRLRWAGKWRYHEGTNSKLLAVYIFLFHLSVLVLPFFVLMGDISVYILLGLLVAKAIVELFFLRPVCTWLKVRWSWVAFIILQVVYPIYAVGVALAALFKTPFWKGRPLTSS